MIQILIFSVCILLLPSILFLTYPIVLYVLSSLIKKNRVNDLEGSQEKISNYQIPSVAYITVSSNLDSRLKSKIAEFIDFKNYFPTAEIFVGFDGSEQASSLLKEELLDERIQWIKSPFPRGKNAVLADIHDMISADIAVFSDVDAQVSVQSIKKLLARFADPGIGAVTGIRHIVDKTRFGEGQRHYAGFDQSVRLLESKCVGNITSCDGKLYAIRTELIDKLPPDVTDDLYTALGAIEKGMRLTVESDAIAHVGRPARDMAHEFVRRRRVTARGLSTLYNRKKLLNPFRFGFYSYALACNKLMRRLSAPTLMLALLLALSTILIWFSGHSTDRMNFLVIVFIPCLVLFIFLVRKPSVFYTGLGMIGMAAGTLDFIRGRRITQWVPQKGSQALDSNGVNRCSIVYFVSHFPKSTETFIVDEVKHLSEKNAVYIVPVVAKKRWDSVNSSDSLEDQVLRIGYLDFSVLFSLVAESVRFPKGAISILSAMLIAAKTEPFEFLKSLLLIPKAMYIVGETRARAIDHLYAGFASYPATLAWMVNRMTGIPFTFVAHANDIFKNEFLLETKTSDAHAVIAISHFNRDFLTHRLGNDKRDKIHVIPTGVNLESFSCRQDHSINGDAINVLSVGSLLPKKGHEFVIEAIHALRMNGTRINLKIVGSGPEFKKLSSQVEKYGLSEYVQMVGEKPREVVVQMLRESDLFVLACVAARDKSADGIPVALMEAMAAGVPVITTSLRALPELVIDGKTGLLCEPGSAEEIAQALTRLIDR